MNEFAVSLLVALARTTLLLAAAAVVVRAILGATGCSSPRAHRAAWVLVLLQGWLFLQLTVPIPYHEMPPREIPVRGAPAMSDSLGEARPDVTPRVATATPAPIAPEHESAVFAKAVAPVDVARTGATQVPRSPSPAWRARLASAARDWPVLLVGVWLAGIGVLVIRALLHYILFVRGLPPGRPAEDAWVGQWETLLADEGIRRPVRLRMTAQVGPVLCRLPGGWELLLPVDLWRELTPAGRLAVLRHELAHLKRGDAWKSLLVRLLALPHWFNPAAWWAVRRFEEAAEWACDGAATAADPGHAVEYARTLVHLGAPLTQHLAYGPAARGHGLSVRVRRLLSPGTVEDSIMKRLLVITIALGLVVACLLRFDLVAKEAASGTDVALASARETSARTETPAGGPETEPIAGVPFGMPSGRMPGAPMVGGDSGPSGGPGGAMPLRLPSMPSGWMPGGMPMPPPPSGYSGLDSEELGREARLPAVRKLPLKSLRYDGKSFDQWQNEWKTELKPERRAEAINAFAAFGANGYGEEAAEAILEVMRGLEMKVTDADFSKSSFEKGVYAGTRLVKMSAIAGFLDIRPDFRIPPNDAVKVLTRELGEGNRNGRMFAIFALQNMGHEAKAAAPALAKTFEGDEDPTVRACAYLALANLGEATPMSPSALRTLLNDAEPQALGSVLMALVPHPTFGGFASSSIFQWDPASTQTMDGGYGADMFGGGYPGMPSGGMGGYGGMGMMMPTRRRVLRPGTEPIVETLVEAATSKSPTVRAEAIQALGRIVPVTNSVIPGLIRAFEKGTADDRRLILDTFQSFIRPSGGVGGGGMDGEMGMSPNPQGTTPFDVKDVTAKLIETLDPRSPADLQIIGAIGARFTESASQVTPILGKAAQDENEEVRRTATQVLEAMTRARKMGGSSGMGMGMF